MLERLRPGVLFVCVAERRSAPGAYAACVYDFSTLYIVQRAYCFGSGASVKEANQIVTYNVNVAQEHNAPNKQLTEQ
jgi:hypothetical protein